MTTVGEIMDRVYRALDAAPDQPAIEGLVAGNRDQQVTRIATCFSPSVNVLSRAAQAGCDLVIADGHPFYTYDSTRVQQTRLDDVINTPVGLAKQQLVSMLDIPILRFTTAYAARYPAGAAMALAEAWGFAGAAPPTPEADYVVADIAEEEFEPLARRLSQENGCNGIRLIGHAGVPVRRVAIGTGMLSPVGMGRMLADAQVGAVIGGEVVEWEGGPYFEDVVSTGREVGLILTGFAMSREPIARALAALMREIAPAIKVVELMDSDPVWVVPAGEAA